MEAYLFSHIKYLDNYFVKEGILKIGIQQNIYIISSQEYIFSHACKNTKTT